MTYGTESRPCGIPQPKKFTSDQDITAPLFLVIVVLAGSILHRGLGFGMSALD